MERILEIFQASEKNAQYGNALIKADSEIARLEKKKNDVHSGVEIVVSSWESKVGDVCKKVIIDDLLSKYREYINLYKEYQEKKKILPVLERKKVEIDDDVRFHLDIVKKRIDVYAEQIKKFEKIWRKFEASSEKVADLGWKAHIVQPFPGVEEAGMEFLERCADKMENPLSDYVNPYKWKSIVGLTMEFYLRKKLGDYEYRKIWFGRKFKKRLQRLSLKIHLFFKYFVFWMPSCRKLMRDTNRAVAAFKARGKYEIPLIEEERARYLAEGEKLKEQFPDNWNVSGNYEKTRDFLSSTEKKLESLKGAILKYLRCFSANESQVQYWFDKRQYPANSPLRAGDLPIAVGYNAIDFTEEKKQLLSILELDKLADDRAFRDLYRWTGSVASFENKLRAYRDAAIAKIDESIASAKKKAQSYKAAIKANAHWKEDWVDMLCTDPVVAGVPFLDYEKNNAKSMCESMRDSAQKRYVLPYFAYPFESDLSVPSIPRLIQWQDDGAMKNLMFTYGEGKKAHALECLNSTLVTILMAFRIKSVKITFIDMATSNDGAFFTTRFSEQICEVVNRDQDLRQKIEHWQAKASFVGRYTNDILSYNKENETILTPYEIAVLLGKPNSSIMTQLSPFIENGNKYGLYFFALFPVEDANGGPNHFMKFLARDNSDSDYSKRSVIPIIRNGVLAEEIFSYIDRESRVADRVQAISQDVDEMFEDPYYDAFANFSVPIGMTNGREVYFQLSDQHVHSFVIGQTGQGKSKLLHDIIAGSALCFAPDDLQIYLLDFKMGGEELYQYKGVKHVSAILASGKDLRVTYGIMNDLRKKMDVRGEKMRMMNVQSLEEYNERSEEIMPRILLVVDECQDLFRDTTHRQPGEASLLLDIRNIVEDIARKGRSQGVHLLLSTQTLSGTQLPPAIKNNITDKFIFRCAPEDADQLASGSGKKVSQFKAGTLLYNSCDGDCVFQAYLPDIGAMVEAAKRKASEYEAAGQFVFDGKTMLSFDDATVEWIKAKSRRMPSFALGKSQDVKQEIIGSTLKAENTENILFVGYNHAHVCRASLSALFSLMLANQAQNQGYKFFCLDLLHSEDEAVTAPLEALRRKGLEMLNSSQCGAFLSEMAEAVRKQEEKKVVFFILGQERFKAVRDEYELPGAAPQPAERPMGFGRQPVKTYRSELKFILENGAEYGIHVLLQVDKVSNLLFEQSVIPKFVNRMFNYVCLLRCEQGTEARLGLDGIYPNMLSDEDTNLAAWFVNDSTGKKDKFTPYMSLSDQLIDKAL